MYIELKTGYSDNGPAWIGKVTFSKTGKTIYFNGQAFKRIKGSGISGNYFDIETGDEYWISGIKKDSQNRHWAGSGKISIEEDVVDEYKKLIDVEELNENQYILFKPTKDDIKQKIYELENRPLEND